MSEPLTHARLLELIHYDPETGIFLNRPGHPWRGSTEPLGTPADGGYLVTKIDRVMHYMHRLAWFYVTGSWPEHEVDHRDRDKANNRWLNLRPATDKQQAENRGVNKNSKTGVCGVSCRAKKGVYEATIRHKGEYHHLGTFTRLEDAKAAREAAEKALYTHADGCVPDPKGFLEARAAEPRKMRSDSTSGHRGVTFLPKKGVYIARHVVNGERQYLGTFKTFDEAVIARLRSEAKTRSTLTPPECVPRSHTS